MYVCCDWMWSFSGMWLVHTGKCHQSSWWHSRQRYVVTLSILIPKNLSHFRNATRCHAPHHVFCVCLFFLTKYRIRVIMTSRIEIADVKMDITRTMLFSLFSDRVNEKRKRPAVMPLLLHTTPKEALSNVQLGHLVVKLFCTALGRCKFCLSH